LWPRGPDWFPRWLSLFLARADAAAWPIGKGCSHGGPRDWDSSTTEVLGVCAHNHLALPQFADNSCTIANAVVSARLGDELAIAPWAWGGGASFAADISIYRLDWQVAPPHGSPSSRATQPRSWASTARPVNASASQPADGWRAPETESRVWNH
ncbi:hypothetical protein TOPH_00546, partial [Tolypocladium ophioglossoides CBS 100239]